MWHGNKEVIMETAIVLSGLDKYPSIKEALTVNREGAAEARNDLVILGDRLKVAEEKIGLAKELGLPLQGFCRMIRQAYKERYEQG